MNEEENKINFLNEPLTTEDGFLNEACIKELNSYIKNMPKTYERLKNDKEWNYKSFTTINNIVSSFAKFCITTRSYKKDKYLIPFGIEKILGYLSACLLKNYEWDIACDGFISKKLSLCDINKMLHDILYEQGISLFDDWNKSDGPLGDCWIDLDALLHNVCLDIRMERREFDRFNKKFKKEEKNRKNNNE